MVESELPSFVDRCRAELDARWREEIAPAAVALAIGIIPADIAAAIVRSINSKTKTYRYVIPTQILAKVVEPALDCRSIQEGASLAGAFDGRTICHSVIVPFDRANHNVLGGSTEPYVNNPLRIASVTAAFRGAQKNKEGFDDLCLVLDFAQANAGLAPLETIPKHQNEPMTIHGRL
jgi:hypothetical protein